MRIAYLINSMEGGGAAFPIPHIVRLLQKSGHEVAVFALMPRDRRATRAISAAGIALSVREGGSNDHIRAYRWLIRQLDAWRPELIWTSLTRATVLGQLYAMRRRLPAIHWQHNAYLKRANLALLRCLKPWATLWIADSHCVAQVSRRRLAIHQDRLVCWPIFCADLQSSEIDAHRPESPIRIGSLGRLHFSKGFDILIEAAAKLASKDGLPPFTIEIAGEGSERARLRALIDQHKAPVRLLGHVDDPKIFLQGLHLYVQPSLYEGFCIAVHEALASGLPVVASAVGEIAHSITPETGILIPRPNANLLADALGHLLRHADQRHAMGEAAKADMSRRYSADRFEKDGLFVLQRLEKLI